MQVPPKPELALLLPCPFCGETHIGCSYDGEFWRVGCDCCECTGPRYNPKELAIEKWNTRTKADK